MNGFDIVNTDLNDINELVNLIARCHCNYIQDNADMESITTKYREATF